MTGGLLPSRAIELAIQARLDYGNAHLEKGLNILGYLITGKENYERDLAASAASLNLSAAVFLMNNEIKIQATRNLLEFSLLFNQGQKEAILVGLKNFRDFDLGAFGKLLAVEYKNWEVLDKQMVSDLMKSFEKYSH